MKTGGKLMNNFLSGTWAVSQMMFNLHPKFRHSADV